MSEPTVHIDVLREAIRALEAQTRFSGKPYPAGMAAFPFFLKGQGFFPGGDGLWRDNAEIRERSSGTICKGGVLFLANDFGTLESYQRLRTKSFENPWTWKNVKQRVLLAGVPVNEVFFTNAILGLRTDDSALAKKNWESNPTFARMCGEFLSFQLDAVAPRLIVVLGPNARKAMQSPVLSGSKLNVLYSSHPYADHMVDGQRARAVEELRRAWQDCTT